MQELAILLSSIAGAASAVAVRKFPRKPAGLSSIGASKHVKNQLSSLKIEKDILNKTIARLYEDSNLSKIQRDGLLLKYQHQLGIILAKLERIKAAGDHPDLGPVGDGLITLMDQKLSQLDNRLYELSSRITASTRIVEEEKAAKKTDGQEQAKGIRESFSTGMMRSSDSEIIGIPRAKRDSMEITTLTSIPNGSLKYPLDEKPQPVRHPAKPIHQEVTEHPSSGQLKMPKTEPIKSEPHSTVIATTKHEGPDIQDDDKDLEKIKGDLLRVISKLEQAEVE